MNKKCKEIVEAGHSSKETVTTFVKKILLKVAKNSGKIGRLKNKKNE